MTKLNKYFILFLLALLLVNSKKSLANLGFDVGYYGNKYIYKSDYRLSFRESFFDDLVNVGGYIKQVSINESGFENYILKHNNIFNLQRKIKIDKPNENYFYKLYLGLKLFDFDYLDLQNSIFFNVSYYNSIKNFEYLNLTFVDDIYERYGFGLDYYFSGSNFITDLFVDYIITTDKIKDTISTGFSTQYYLNSALTLAFGYDYSKSFIKDKSQQTLIYDVIVINYSYKDLENDSHTFRLNTILKLDDYLNVNLGLSYMVNKDYDNSVGFNVNLGF